MCREGPEREAQDGIRDAPGEHPSPLRSNQFRLGHWLGSEDRSHPGEFPVLDHAHEEWKEIGAIRISRTSSANLRLGGSETAGLRTRARRSDGTHASISVVH